MARKRCPSASLVLEKEAGRAVLVAPDGPDHNRTYTGGSIMADYSQYGDSTPKDNSGKPNSTWQSLGDLARALAEKAAQK